jgi:chromosomal replication initiation ATPase DnaA
VNIGPPEYETRVAIIKKWIEARLQILGPGVADAMGRFPFQTVTEILSALSKVLEIQGLEDRPLTPDEAVGIIEKLGEGGGDGTDTELGRFLNEISDTVAAKVKAQEAPWRRKIRELAEEIEAEGFKAYGLRRLVDGEGRPRDLDSYLKDYRETVQRLKEIRIELDAAGNPWPEAAHGVLRDPERLDEAEALLSSARERARPFPEIPPGPGLDDLGGELPQLVLRAADQLVTTDRPEYNPLYVWSPDGMAARLLLQAAGRTKQAEEGEEKVALISVPRFADEFIHSLSQGVAGAWRERWWSADFLFIDGAHALSATERAQEEFFHLFEALLRRKARIMIAGNQPPTTIPALDDRLRGRLEGGLVVEVEVAESELSPDLLEVLRLTAPEERTPAPEKKDISDVDREWIRSFKPGRPGAGRRSASPGEGDYSEYLEVVAAGTGDESRSEPWVPSPEQVVWIWPRLEDRLVEELD